MTRLIRMVRRFLNNPIYLRHYMEQGISIVKLIIAAFITVLNRKRLFSKNVWLVSEKGTEARDNGYHFYKFLKNNHPEINCRFVIKKDAPDATKIGNSAILISPKSIKHYIYSLSAKAIISSQAFGAMSMTAYKLSQMLKGIRRKDQVVIFLQHGIVYNELPQALNYRNTEYDLFCCSSERERIFLRDTLGYPNENILTLGLCRFDNLMREHEIKKQILIMPTHRMWIHAAVSGKEATQKEMESFENSDFYLTYSHLLKNETLMSYARGKGYNIVFYPHYALQPFVRCFSKFNNDTIIIADKEHFDVQKLLLESSLLITDYSSVFFDFAYMYKPEVFYQFDEQRFHSEHFKKGYFDYSMDAFGLVCINEIDVVNEIIRIIDNECKMDNKYKERVDNFFLTRDSYNCKRTFDVIYRKANEK